MREPMRAPLRQVGLSLLMAGSMLGGLYCGGEDIAAPTTGSLEITTATSGPEPDTDGYLVTVDDGTQTAIGTNATLLRESVEPGVHSVRLAGVANNCAVADENPRSSQVEAGKTASLNFVITCAASAGAIRVSVATSGSPADPDGYVAKLDGGDPGLPLPTDGTVTFSDVPVGSHAVVLTEIAADCSVTGGPSRSVTVVGGETAELGFAVACSPARGSIQVTTTTTGSSVDPDGYTVSVDGAAGQVVGSNAALTLEDLSLGSHALTLSGIAGNCHLEGENPRPVEVVPGSTTAAFQLSCLGADALIAFGANAVGLQAIFVVNADGTGLRNLTPEGGFETNPTWSPDGRKILFSRVVDLWVMNADGSGRLHLADGDGIFSHHWSPDGRMIAYVNSRSTPEDVVDELWVMQADGSGQIKVADEAFDFSWSPDGRLVYTSEADLGDVHLRIINADGSGDSRLTNQAAFEAAWSPDGTRIAFVTLGEKDIFLINPDGSGEVNLTQGLSDDDEPAWSPDGSRIAFSTTTPTPSDENEIAVMNRDGGSRTVLTDPPGFDFEPGWSPDGTRIVFTRSDLGGDSEIYVMNADGSNQTDLTNTPDVRETTPAWNGQQAGAATVATRQSEFHDRWLRANRLRADRLH